MYKLKSFCAFLLFSYNCSAFADTEFEDSIPVEIVEALFDFYQYGQLEIFSDVAQEFPDFPIPDGFSVVGSVSQLSMLRVVFETTLNEDDAIQSIFGVFESQDWIRFPAYFPQLQEVGFISPRQINTNRPQSLCHNDLGRITVSYVVRGNRNFLSTAHSLTGGNQGDCEQQIATQQASLARIPQSSGLRQYLPRMEISESLSVPRYAAFMSGGSSSSGNTVEVDTVVTSEQDIEEVYRYFADQIEDQGWELDSEAVGDLSASGTWTKSPETDLNLVGRLSVLESTGSNYELQFRLTGEGFAGGNSAIFSPRGL